MPQNGPQVYMVTIKTCIFTNCLLWIGQRLLGRCSLYREMPLHIRLSGSSLTYILNWYDNCMKILLSNDIFTLACNAKKNNWSTRSCWILSSPVLPVSIFFARLSRGNTHTSRLIFMFPVSPNTMDIASCSGFYLSGRLLLELTRKSCFRHTRQLISRGVSADKPEIFIKTSWWVGLASLAWFQVPETCFSSLSILILLVIVPTFQFWIWSLFPL